jgi:hypothetical protein
MDFRQFKKGIEIDKKGNEEGFIAKMEMIRARGVMDYKNSWWRARKLERLFQHK